MSLKVADQVRAEMARRRVKQKDLVSALEMAQPAVSRRMNGKVPFNVDELAKIAELLGVRIVDLIPQED